MTYLTVDLYSDFNCIADACPNTCCRTWNISIDDGTYKKMHEKENELGIPTEEWIHEVDDCHMVKLQADGRCPMLNENNLCKVVLALDPSYLSYTCTTYPRRHAQFGSVLEGCLSTSCPEVVASLMSKKEQIQFDFAEDDTISPPYGHTQLYLYESAVRSSITDLLYNFPEITLHTRLYASFDIINEAISRCQENIPNFSELKEYIDGYYPEGVMTSLDSKLQNIVSETSRYGFLRRMISLLPEIINPLSAAKYKKLIQQTIDYFTQTDYEEYLKNMRSFTDMMCSYGTFHTNYWVYRIFVELMSVPNYSEVKEKFIYIGIEFCLIQIVAMAAYAQNNEFDQDEYIYIISSISRMEHSPRKKLVEQLHKNNLVSNAGLLLLII